MSTIGVDENRSSDRNSGEEIEDIYQRMSSLMDVQTELRLRSSHLYTSSFLAQPSVG